MSPSKAPPPTPTAATPDIPCHRESLEGCWILDKTRGSENEWSMSPYLEVMQVDPLAIQAHEKGDRETDTYHTIEFLNNHKAVKLVKRSRVNNDLTLQLPLGNDESAIVTEYLHPGERPKRQRATSNHPGHLQIQSSLQTLSHGVATVTDVKELVQETVADGRTTSVMIQRLTIVNDLTQKSHSVTRYFVPFQKTPPHLEEVSKPPTA